MFFSSLLLRPHHTLVPQGVAKQVYVYLPLSCIARLAGLVQGCPIVIDQHSRFAIWSGIGYSESRGFAARFQVVKHIDTLAFGVADPGDGLGRMSVAEKREWIPWKVGWDIAI